MLESGSLVLDEQPNQVTLDSWFWYITSIEDMMLHTNRLAIQSTNKYSTTTTTTRKAIK
jgi:hypothetical protein